MLHCPWNIGGHPAMLAKCERELGLHSHCLTLRGDAYGFAADEVLFAGRMSSWRQEWQRLRLLCRALWNFDVIHFNFGQSLLEHATAPRLDFTRPWFTPYNALVAYRYYFWMADLPLLRRLNKVVAMTFQGDDARQGDYCRVRFDISPAHEVDHYTAETDAYKRRAIRKVAANADRVYALNPDLLHVLPPQTRFLPYASVDPAEWRPPAGPANEVPVVLHAPTHRGAKGTRHLLEAAEVLRREGVDFELLLVENLRRDEARRLYERADLVVDQLLTGWYGGFAVEAMCLAKPVVCYIRDGDMAPLPQDLVAELPIIRATPATLGQVLRYWLAPARRERLRELGERSREFAERWHDPKKIAAQTAGDYERLYAERRFRRRRPVPVSDGGWIRCGQK
ncbi:MAG TPA: hypothetical protein VGF07_11035 [Stellaceae bacterium]